MGILKKLFSFGKKSGGPYIDKGSAMARKLTATLNLPDWKGPSPIHYTDAEVRAINKDISGFQEQANQRGGEGKVFVVRSDLVPTMQQMFAASALTTLANDSWKFSSDLPTNWKQCVSSYLKAWVIEFDPLCLIDLGDLLVKAGHRAEAKEVFQVALLFPMVRSIGSQLARYNRSRHRYRK